MRCLAKLGRVEGVARGVEAKDSRLAPAASLGAGDVNRHMPIYMCPILRERKRNQISGLGIS